MSEPFNIVDLFYAAARNHPLKAAIIYKNKSISFAELEKEVTATAHYFIRKGIRKSDRVFVFVPMSIDLYRIVLALFRIGATAVFIDEWVSVKRMQECCRVAQCKALIGISKVRLFSLFIPELRKIPIKLGVSYNAVQSPEPLPVTIGNDTALITFTTGSTGTPKAAKRTHGFLNHQFEALSDIIQAKPDDVDMPVLPIVLLINLGTASTSVIADYKASKPHLLKPEVILHQIKMHGVNRITASPFFIKTIAEFVVKQNISCNNIRRMFTGGAPVFPQEAALLSEAFHNANIEIVYGSTEAEPISRIDANELKSETITATAKGLKVGRIDPHIRIRIIKMVNGNIALSSDEELAAMALLPYEIGEIIVNGAHVLTEYFNNEEALRRNKIFIGDACWHRTGDCGYLDEDNILYLSGRCASLIRKEGEYLSPFIYEGYFKSLAGVETGTVLLLNDTITAVIQLKDRQKEALVRDVIQKQHPVLNHIVFIKKMPMDPRHNTKIDYEKLKTLVKR